MKTRVSLRYLVNDRLLLRFFISTLIANITFVSFIANITNITLINQVIHITDITRMNVIAVITEITHISENTLIIPSDITHIAEIISVSLILSSRH